MATHPITDLLAALEILAFQALDFGAQLHYFPARVLDWVNQLRGGVARTTDLYQLVDHDHLGLPRRPRFGKRRVPPSARELVRENKRNSQDRVDAFPVDGALGWRLCLPD